MLFGTDGIRGEVNLSSVDDEEAVQLCIEERTISPAIMRLVGEALARIGGQQVVIGWDDRPGISMLHL